MGRRLEDTERERQFLLCYVSVLSLFCSANNFRSSFYFVLKEFLYFLFCSCSQFLFSFSSSFRELILFSLVLLLVLVHENIVGSECSEA